MERGKQSGSSFAYDLFGVKESPSSPSSSGIFSTIFPPPATAFGQQALHSVETEKKNGSGSEAWNSKTGGLAKNGGGSEGHKRSSTKEMLELYPEEKVKPFHYNSSIYYGAQDVYFQPEGTQKPGITPASIHISKDQKNGGGEDLDGALRGNWWQGSLYY